MNVERNIVFESIYDYDSKCAISTNFLLFILILIQVQESKLIPLKQLMISELVLDLIIII